MGYLFIILALTIGWFRIKQFNGTLNDSLLTVSVVVAVRNEETNILKLLSCLVHQDYSRSNFEVIIVDDHSEDNTIKIAEDFIAVNHSDNIKVINSPGEGKKNALAVGFNQAKGDLILTTDGDCEMGPKWISRIVAFFQSTSATLVIAPVCYHNEKNILQHFFSLDFMSLVASGAGSVGIAKPIMGNGANLAFMKDSVVNSTRQGNSHVSGDDVFLIQQIAKSHSASSIQFIKDTEVVVQTNSPSSLNEFFNQRIRWASKAKAYKSVWAVVVSLVVFLFNLMLTISIIAGLFHPWMFAIFGLFIVFKLLIDLPLLYEFSGFINKRKLMVYFPVFELVYPIYIVISAVVGLFFRFEWKGRKDLR